MSHVLEPLFFTQDSLFDDIQQVTGDRNEQRGRGRHSMSKGGLEQHSTSNWGWGWGQRNEQLGMGTTQRATGDGDNATSNWGRGQCNEQLGTGTTQRATGDKDDFQRTTGNYIQFTNTNGQLYGTFSEQLRQT